MIKSWDCFDTLIARYFHRPLSIFQEIADITNDNSFVQKRINAEKISIEKTLKSIYKNIPNHDPDLELELEKKYSYPIKENFNRINDGDIIVSDMYLSAEEIFDILSYHELNKNVKIYSTYGEKSNGNIWETLKNKYNIEYHIGDNIYADNITARQRNINTIYYGGSNLTSQEKLIERYNPYLAYWVKYIRLSNPYFIPYQQFYYNNGSISYYYGIYWIKEDNGDISILQQLDDNNKTISLVDKFSNTVYQISKNDNFLKITDENSNKKQIHGFWIEQPVNTKRFDEKILWTEQASYNIPLLINSSYLLPKNIVFTYRDCYFWKKIYDSIFETNTPVLQSCRNAYLYPYNKEYIDYILNITQDKIIVDLHGTGNSSHKFFKSQNIYDKNIFFISEHADDNTKNINIKNMALCFDRIFPENNQSTIFHHNMIASKNSLKCCSGTTLEKFNIPPRLGAMVGWDNEPIRKKSEHIQDICYIFDECVNCAINISSIFKNRIIDCEDLTEVLLKQINKPNYSDSVIHSLWDKSKNIKLI